MRSPSSTSTADMDGEGTMPECWPWVCPMPLVGSNATPDGVPSGNSSS
eukprot:CAMPEP_0196725326 /NCGR_PEP_ID=MMETSP1091-20130531/6929_1 /TAXON_ID=302021 /ORGANISM="Rhodomonas sp., Strain CCMP768" /LENGTH=47 /DNA_ID= /DNA_START= /DNA_END= /DNA_ORIENTATION=